MHSELVRQPQAASSRRGEQCGEGYAAGAVDYLAKPYRPDILRSKVGVFVDLYRKQRQIARQQELLRSSERRELEFKRILDLRESEERFADIVGSAMDAIIVFDGYSADTLSEQGTLSRGMALLEKPFTPTLLASKVLELLTITR